MKKIVDVKRRISVLMDVWKDVIEMWESYGGSLTRTQVVKMLSDAYERESIRPLKGISNPSDLFDKEMASLYAVGKYGMGLEEAYPELFDTIFGEEIKYENVAEIITREPPERAREKVKVLVGELDDNLISRIFRLRLTEVFFGFRNKESLLELIKSSMKIFPEREKAIRNYMKFYIAFAVAEAISKREVKDKIGKEVLKQALALELGLEKKSLPDDEYIRAIATEVFNIPQKVLANILSVRTRRVRS